MRGREQATVRRIENKQTRSHPRLLPDRLSLALPCYLHENEKDMLERKQTINEVEYSYEYGGNGTIRVTDPVRVLIDLKQMPQVAVTPEGEVGAEQQAHLNGALQAIIADMFAQMPQR